MRNAEYWRGRALILEEAAHKRAEELTTGLDEIYDEAMRETLKELESWYLRLAKNNNLTLADAKKLLTKNELDEFHWDVEKYIKVGEDHGLEPDWMKKLENASAKFHISRLEAVEVKIQQQIERLHAGQVGKLDKHLRQVAGETYLRTAYEVQKGVGIGFDITALDKKKLDTFISNPWSTDDRTFRDRCWTMKENLVESVRKSLIKGLIRGDAPGKLTKEIQKEFNVSKYKAGRLVNTETAYFAMQSTKQCYKDINVDMVEIVGTLDSHTCDLCGSFDGKVIRMTDFAPGETVPPWHPNCRCTTAPAIPDEYKGTRVSRDEDGKQYEVPEGMSFEEWKKAQEEHAFAKLMKTDTQTVEIPLDKSEKSGIIDTRRESDLGYMKKRLQNDKAVSEEYYSTIKDKFAHGSDDAKHTFAKLVPDDSVGSGKYAYTPYYDSKTKKIYMNYDMDVSGKNERGGGVTWFHEHGHMVDDLAGQVSKNDEFINLLKSDYKDYMKSYGKAHSLNTYPKVQKAIGEDLNDMRKHSAVSDILGAISQGNIQGIAGHSAEYWKDDSVIAAESFAHMFEAQFDETRYKEMKKYFPNALKKFESILGGVAK